MISAMARIAGFANASKLGIGQISLAVCKGGVQHGCVRKTVNGPRKRIDIFRSGEMHPGRSLIGNLGQIVRPELILEGVRLFCN